jgi:purine-binding chemotaxis protein CheW
MNHSPQNNSLEFGLTGLDLNASLFTDEPKPQIVGEKYIAFSQGGELYAVSSKKVIEVTAALTVALLPNAPEWLHGIANLRGEIISVLNFPIIFGRRASKLAPKSKFIVLRSQAFEFGVAFAADRLNEIVTLPDEKIQSIKDETSPFIFGKAVHQSNALNLIDMEKLLASLTI